ncbi:TPA: phage portal protein [Bacillus cereus]|jgi:SPP1 family phage portal protein|uniref:phage portal protein n=1 Tax=Bacillus cereus TaxID=1396 RepID=UPI0019272412|nr:phage portal protein [Bacillus cereus]MBL3768808.1 phage portal protein [Bacillus cereus]HDR4393006.1 phage portal protein [Bacillus cereus]
MFRLDSDTPVTGEIINKLIEKHCIKREIRLKKYYDGEHDILERKFDDETKPNNKIVTNFCQYITNVSVGYFMGKPISYSCHDKTYMEQLQEIFDLNDEQHTNASLANNCSIYGYGAEIIYTTMNAANELEIRFDYLDLEEQKVIFVYDRSIEKNLIMAIRYYDHEDVISGKGATEIFVYTADSIYQYIKMGNEIQLFEEKAHFFGEVPLNPYFNKNIKSDFEEVMTLNDAYNLLQSDDINESNYSNDAYLVIMGMLTDDKDVSGMKEKRVIELFGENAKAEWLIKDINDTWKENLKTRLKKDIHDTAAVPDLSDSSFGGTQTGEAMKYKLKPLEDNRVVKERLFKQAIQRRIRLITNILNKQGNHYDWRDVIPRFSPNLPKSDLTIDEIIKLNAAGFMSKETGRTLIPAIEDPFDEAEKVEQEKEEYIDLDNLPPDEDEENQDEINDEEEIE